MGFYSNATGSPTGVLEAALLLCHGPALLLASRLVLGPGPHEEPSAAVLEVLSVALPLVLLLTVASDVPVLAASLCALALFCCTLLYFAPREQQESAERSQGQTDELVKLFRGYNTLLVCLSVLAVDFAIFPRRFCKTELRGVSLMDLGTGTTVVASALSSHLARTEAASSPSSSSSSSSAPASAAQSSTRPRRGLGGGLHVLGLGLLRLVAVKVTGYREQPTELGSHWNFFLTLFAVWLAGSAMAGAVRRLGWGSVLAVAAALAATFEGCLQQGPRLGQAILHHPRPPLPLLLLHSSSSSLSSSLALARELLHWAWWHNREGIVSVWSHSLIFLLAAALSRACGLSGGYGDGDGSGGRRRVGQWSVFFRLASAAASCLAVVAAARCWLPQLEPSRRQGNATYVLLVLGLAATVVAALELARIASSFAAGRSCYSRSLLSHLADRALPVFVLANVLTGLCNLGFQAAGRETSNLMEMPALLLLLVYCAVLCTAALTGPAK